MADALPSPAAQRPAGRPLNFDEKQGHAGPACAVFPSLPGCTLFEQVRALDDASGIWDRAQVFVASRVRGLGVKEPGRATRDALHVMRSKLPTRVTLERLRAWRVRLGASQEPRPPVRSTGPAAGCERRAVFERRQKGRAWWPVRRETARLRAVAWALELAAARLDGGAYLDVGCAEGQLTAAVAGALGLPKERAFACDVVPQPESPNYVFTRCGDRTLPFEDSTFAFITAFMAAHHFVDAAGFFREIRRVLRPGGLFLLREHDCRGAADAAFYDVVHASYACVFSTECTPAAFAAEYRAEYRAAEGWTALAVAAGFRPVAGGSAAPDQFDSVHLLFE